jgi:hypothetical protein
VARVCYISKEEDSELGDNNNMEKAKEALQPLQTYGKSFMDTVKMRSYFSGLQKMAVHKSSYYYQAAANCASIPKEGLEKLCNLAKNAPSANAVIMVQPMGGCLKGLKEGEIPMAQMFAAMKYWFIVNCKFPEGKANPEMREKSIEWAHECYKVLEPYRILMDTESDSSSNPSKRYLGERQGNTITIGGNQDRLVQLKNLYDPDNFFKHNRNIKPAV